MEEIKAAMGDMEDDKAPGPDGFNANFIKVCWEIVQKDLFKMVTKYQRCEKIGGSTNSAFLALIPKEKDATTFDRFHPFLYVILDIILSLKSWPEDLKTSCLISFLRTKEASLKEGESGTISFWSKRQSIPS